MYVLIITLIINSLPRTAHTFTVEFGSRTRCETVMKALAEEYKKNFSVNAACVGPLK